MDGLCFFFSSKFILNSSLLFRETRVESSRNTFIHDHMCVACGCWLHTLSGFEDTDAMPCARFRFVGSTYNSVCFPNEVEVFAACVETVQTALNYLKCLKSSLRDTAAKLFCQPHLQLELGIHSRFRTHCPLMQRGS